MKRLQYDRYGGPEVMRLAEFEPPRPGPDEVLVRVRATASNALDWKMRNGGMKLMTGRSFPRAMGTTSPESFPLVPKLTAATGRKSATVWATKRNAATSSVAVCQARTADDPGGVCLVQVRTTASASSSAYKQQIRDQIAAGRVLPEGGVAVQLAFVVGPCRAWPNLWKATIDALGTMLGREPGASEWNPREGRITDVGLHCTVDPAAGDEVTVGIRAGTLGQLTNP